MNRRQALISLGLGTAGILVAPRAGRALAVPPGPGAADLAELAGVFRGTPRGEILQAGARAARAGAGYRDILGGAFLAGILDVRPRHVGGKLHCVMMVESAFQMCQELPGEEALLLALWNLDDFKRSQAQDAAEGDWVLPETPRPARTSGTAARAEFAAAMEAWDDGKADRALAGLIPHHGRESLFEILWPFAARSFVDIGHKIIYAAQVDRVLARLPWRHAAPALRSLVYGLLHRNSDDGRTSAYERSCELASGLPAGWMEGRERPEESLAIMRELRTAGPAGAQRIVVEAFGSGLGPRTVWDGLRLAASEIFLRRPGAPPGDRRSLLPVHAVTVTEALGHAFRASRSETTRRIMILQAAGWLPDMRGTLESLGAQDPGGRLLDTLADGASGTPCGSAAGAAEALGASDARLVLGIVDGTPGGAGAVHDAMRRGLARGGLEHHQHKYTAASIAESRRVHPRWVSSILAPAAGYVPAPGGEETELARRAAAEIRKAGLTS